MNTLEGHTRYVSLMSSHNIIIVCSRSNNGTVCIWDSNAKVINKAAKGPEYNVWHVWFNTTGTRLLSDDFDEDYCVWNCQTDK